MNPASHQGNNPSEPRQAWDDYNFDNAYAHNYWADWTEPDEDSDGIVDRPYSIEKRTHHDMPNELFSSDWGHLTDHNHLGPIEALRVANRPYGSDPS